MHHTGTLTHPDDPDHFTFVVFGDNRPCKGKKQPKAIREIFSEIHELIPAPAFALSLGDIIEGKPKNPDKPSELETIILQFSDFLGLAAKAGVPIFNAPGNHEMDDSHDIPSLRMHDLYEKYVGPSYGAFTYGNSRFIALNTEDVPPPGTPSPPSDAEFSYMSPKQFSQLKEDLDHNRDKKHIFITMHYPIFALDEGPPDHTSDDRLNEADRNRLFNLFQDYDNIAYVLAAHEHLYYNPKDPDNVTDAPGWSPGNPIRYLISGGAGAPLSTKKDKKKYSFHHYLIFTVDGAEVSVELVRLQSSGASS